MLFLYMYLLAPLLASASRKSSWGKIAKDNFPGPLHPEAEGRVRHHYWKIKEVTGINTTGGYDHFVVPLVNGVPVEKGLKMKDMNQKEFLERCKAKPRALGLALFRAKNPKNGYYTQFQKYHRTFDAHRALRISTQKKLTSIAYCEPYGKGTAFDRDTPKWKGRVSPGHPDWENAKRKISTIDLQVMHYSSGWNLSFGDYENRIQHLKKFVEFMKPSDECARLSDSQDLPVKSKRRRQIRPRSLSLDWTPQNKGKLEPFELRSKTPSVASCGTPSTVSPPASDYSEEDEPKTPKYGFWNAPGHKEFMAQEDGEWERHKLPRSTAGKSRRVRPSASPKAKDAALRSFAKRRQARNAEIAELEKARSARTAKSTRAQPSRSKMERRAKRAADLRASENRLEKMRRRTPGAPGKYFLDPSGKAPENWDQRAERGFSGFIRAPRTRTDQSGSSGRKPWGNGPRLSPRDY